VIDPDDGIHVETTIDLDRGVIIAEFFKEPDMEPTGETVEISLDDAGFTELLSYMESDPGWEPIIEPLLEDMVGNPDGGVSRDVAWYSADGTTWQPLDPAGPLRGPVQTGDGDNIFAIEATPDGFVAWSHGRVWESTDNGTTWTEGAALTERGWRVPDPLDVLDGTPISVSDQGVWTIEDTPQELIPATGMDGMGGVWVGDFGLFGMQRKGGDVLFSEDGTTWNRWNPTESEDGKTWNRWNPTEIDQEAGILSMVGIGDDFIVLRQEFRGEDAFLWVGTLP
jgi:hypothetical protein